MKKILINLYLCVAILAVGASVTGCAQLQAIETVVTTTVTPTQAIVTANAFNAVKSGATAYLTYCVSTPTDATCSADNRRKVISYVRSGTAARNQIETYITSGGTSIPSAVYNTLVVAVNNLKTTPAANYTGAQ